MPQADGKQHGDNFALQQSIVATPSVNHRSKPNVDTFIQAKLTRNCSGWSN